MKKFILLALLFIPVTSFAASSVRVLGTKSAPGTGGTTTTSAKVLPAKSPSSVAANTGATNSRIGTVRANTKSTTGTVSTANANATSRFPVITPAHSYNSVTTPKSGTTTVVSPGFNKQEIIEEVTNNVNSSMTNNYYSKEEVNNIVNELKTEDEDDPRFDMVRTFNPEEAGWDSELVQKRMKEGYVFMWVEDSTQN